MDTMKPGPFGSDDELLAALAEALDTARHPQSRLIVANASDAFGLSRLEEEVAALVYDSLLMPAGDAVRSTEAARFVVFETESLSIEIEIVGGTVVGQIAPAGGFDVTVEKPGEDWLRLVTDELGCFFSPCRPRIGIRKHRCGSGSRGTRPPRSPSGRSCRPSRGESRTEASREN